MAEMNARNQSWVSRFHLERASFRWDLTKAELCFERATDQVVADLCVVGTASAVAGTFLWAWANDAIPAGAKRRIDAVRSFRVTHGLPRLTTPEWGDSRGWRERSEADQPERCGAADQALTRGPPSR